MSKVFISYVRQDRRCVDKIVAVLRENGVAVWLDRDDLRPGQPWKTSIQNAIRSGTKFISIFSRKRKERDQSYINEEMIVAIEEFRKRPFDSGWLISVRLDDEDIEDRPIGGGLSLLDYHVCDMRNFNAGMRSLLHALGVNEPIGLDRVAVSAEQIEFIAPCSSPHAAIRALTRWQEEYEDRLVCRQRLNKDFGERTVQDLVKLGLVQRDVSGNYKISQFYDDIALALSVAIANIPTFQIAVEILKLNFRATGQVIGAAIAEHLGRDWSRTSMQRNGQAYKKWIVVLYPNFGLPKEGDEAFLLAKSLREKQVGHGRNSVITDEVKSKISGWKRNNETIAFMARELGIRSQIIHNWKRTYPEDWNDL